MIKLAPFDAADCLDDEETIAEYLTAALEDSNPEVFLTAVRDVARARGMTQLAKDAGLVLAGAKKRGKMAKKGPMKKVVMDQEPPGPLILRGGRILAQNGSSSVSLTSSSSGASRSWLTRSATFNGKA